jgi:hypothetical protein
MNYGIQHEARFRQANVYEGMVYDRSIRPTDIDGGMDFGNKLFVFFEMKAADAPCPTGQRLFLERITDAITLSKKSACALICEHQHPQCEDIQCADSIVREYRWLFKWRKPEKELTLHEAVNALVELGAKQP